MRHLFNCIQDRLLPYGVVATIHGRNELELFFNDEPVGLITYHRSHRTPTIIRFPLTMLRNKMSVGQAVLHTIESHGWRRTTIKPAIVKNFAHPGVCGLLNVWVR